MSDAELLDKSFRITVEKFTRVLTFFKFLKTKE